MENFFSTDLYNWVVFPLAIFISRMADVSLGTLRGVLAAKGKKKIVPFIGFVEVLLWLFAIGQIMQNLNNFMCYFAWAGGYAMGSFIGLSIEERLAIGSQVVRIITAQQCDELIASLRSRHFGVTEMDGKGARGPVKIIFTVVRRKQVEEVIELLNRHNPNAFYSVEDVKDASQVSYAPNERNLDYFLRLLPNRKGK